jgi:Protein of unknown function (DUF3562)
MGIEMVMATNRNEAVIAELARHTNTAPEVVKNLYESEVADLQASASVPNFIGLIASKRVRRRLRGQDVN